MKYSLPPAVPLSENPWNRLQAHTETVLLFLCLTSFGIIMTVFLMFFKSMGGFLCSLMLAALLYFIYREPHIPWKWSHHPFFAGIERIARRRVLYMVFWYSMSPWERHRWASVLGAIQFHDQKRLDAISKRASWNSLTLEQWRLMWHTACAYNNAEAATKFLDPCVTHMGLVECAGTLTHVQNPYGSEQDLKTFDAFRMNTLECMVREMSGAQLIDMWDIGDMLEKLWNARVVGYGAKMSTNDISCEQSIARIGCVLAQHREMHHLLQKSMHHETQRWAILQDIQLRFAAFFSTRQQQQHDMRVQAMADIQAHISAHHLAQSISLSDKTARAPRKM